MWNVCALWGLLLLASAALGCEGEPRAPQADAAPPRADAGLDAARDEADAAQPDSGPAPDRDAAGDADVDEPDAAADGGMPAAQDAAVPPPPTVPDPVTLPGGAAGACAFLTLPATTLDNPRCPDGVVRGDVQLSSEADVAALRGCVKVVGTVAVQSSTLKSLAGLESLRLIDGSFLASETCSEGYCSGQIRSLERLDGLDHLRCVTGDFLLAEGVPSKLQNIDALRELVEVGGTLELRVTRGERVVPALQRVWGALRLHDAVKLPRLEVAYGAVSLGARTPNLKYAGCERPRYPACHEQVIGCNFRADTQADVDAVNGCVRALRDVTLAGENISSLQPLSELIEVRGKLTIGDPERTGTGQLASLAGLGKLRHAGALELANIAISDTAPLQSVSQISELRVHHLPELQSLSGLTLHEQVTYLYLSDNPKLAQIAVLGGKHAHLAELHRLPQLQDLGSLAQLQSVGNSLQLTECDALQSLSGLSGLTQLQYLRIEGCDALQSLAGLTSLTALSVLGLLDNAALSTLSSLQGLPVHALIVQGNASLSGLSGLDVSALESVTIAQNPVLQSLAGLAGLQHLTGDLRIENNPTLTSLAGLEALQGAYSIIIDGNAMLSQLTGLGALRRVETQLDVRQNAVLENLSALSSLEQFGDFGGLTVEANPELTTLGDLGSLERAYALRVLSCPKLVELGDLSALESLQQLELDGNGALTALDGFANAASIRMLWVRANPQLADLSALANARISETLIIDDEPLVTSLAWLEGSGALDYVSLQGTGVSSLQGVVATPTRPGSVELTSNPQLSDLSALAPLTTARYLSISGNAALQSLRGLSSLNEVSSIIAVADNPALVECEVQWLGTRIGQALPAGLNGPAGVCPP